jgi:hypothetical protein
MHAHVCVRFHAPACLRVRVHMHVHVHVCVKRAWLHVTGGRVCECVCARVCVVT